MAKETTRKSQLKPDDKDQSRRFIEAAREHGADDDGTKADDLLGKLAKTPPEPRKNAKATK